MSEKQGIEVAQSVVKAVGKCGTVVCRFIHKEGLLVLIGLQEPVAVLLATPWPQFLSEMKDVDASERKVLESDLSASFQPPFPVVDKGLDDFLAMGEKTAAVIEKGVAEGKDLYASVKELVGEWKTFLGVN